MFLYVQRQKKIYLLLFIYLLRQSAKAFCHSRDLDTQMKRLQQLRPRFRSEKI